MSRTVTGTRLSPGPEANPPGGLKAQAEGAAVETDSEGHSECDSGESHLLAATECPLSPPSPLVFKLLLRLSEEWHSECDSTE